MTTAVPALLYHVNSERFHKNMERFPQGPHTQCTASHAVQLPSVRR